MQLKISTDYAIRMVLYLAATREIVSSRELSDRLGIPQSIVFKIGRKFNDLRIISISAGVRGGFLLTKAPEDISLYDIICVFEPTIRISRCLEEDKYCSRFATENCPVRKAYCEIQESLERELKSVSISSLL